MDRHPDHIKMKVRITEVEQSLQAESKLVHIRIKGEPLDHRWDDDYISIHLHRTLPLGRPHVAPLPGDILNVTLD